jgi:uncharacterized protein YjbJ (UPF0337 family)
VKHAEKGQSSLRTRQNDEVLLDGKTPDWTYQVPNWMMNEKRTAMRMKRIIHTVWESTNKPIMMKTTDRITTIRSSSFAEAPSTYSRKTKWANPDGLEGTQSLRFANAWKNQITALRVKGIWNDVANKLKQVYASLTDDDLLLVQGDEENLMGRLQQRLDMTPHEIRRLIATL